MDKDSKPLASWTACYLPSSKQFLVESPSSMTILSKESLANLLDLAEALGCTEVFVLARKEQKNFRMRAFNLVNLIGPMVSSLMYLGFQMFPWLKLNNLGFIVLRCILF